MNNYPFGRQLYDFPQQKVTKSTRNKADWYANCIDFVIDAIDSVSSKVDLIKFANIINTKIINKIDKLNNKNEIVYGEKADDLLAITGKAGTINQDHGYDSLLNAILENIRADSYITQEELCDVLSVTRSVLTKAMSRLQASGRLVRVGSRKTGYWQVSDRAGGAV